MLSLPSFLLNSVNFYLVLSSLSLTAALSSPLFVWGWGRMRWSISFWAKISEILVHRIFWKFSFCYPKLFENLIKFDWILINFDQIKEKPKISTDIIWMPVGGEITQIDNPDQPKLLSPPPASRLTRRWPASGHPLLVLL